MTQKDAKNSGQAIEAETAEMRELRWEELLHRSLQTLNHTGSEAVTTRKAAAWKVAIAVHMKQLSTVTNPWLAQQLHMGDPDGVSRYCSECRSNLRPEASELLAKLSDIRV